jgi:PAS domain S-box-containing protein
VSSTSSLGGAASGGSWNAVFEVLDLLAEAITIRDREGRIAYANQAALATMGFASVEELQQRSSRSIMDDYIVQDELGNPLQLEDVPSMRLMQGASAEPLVMRTVHRESGRVNWRQLKATPLHDEHGELVAAVTVIEDVTALKTAEMRMRVLAESGRILASSLDYQQTLHNVARIAVPAIADWCAVDLVDPQLKREHVVAFHQDPSKVALAEEARAQEPEQLDPNQAAGQVIVTGVSQLYPDVSDEMIAQSARDEDHLQLLRALEIRSVLIVPMRVPTRTIGVMTLVTAESRRQLTPEDVELAEQLARRAAVATENARLVSQLSDVSETLQQSLLPEELPPVPGWEIAALYRPAGREQQVEVGGDFYDVFSSDRDWFAIIGDVTGKGVGAAALTSLLRHGCRFAARGTRSPAEILAQLDDELRSRSRESLCTALCMRLQSDRIVVSSGGHPPPLVVSREGSLRGPIRSSPLLGAFDDARFVDQEVPVSPGDTVLLYTDGVTETPGSEDRFGASRLQTLLRKHARDSPAEVLAALDAALEQFQRGDHNDDIAALALRVGG